MSVYTYMYIYIYIYNSIVFYCIIIALEEAAGARGRANPAKVPGRRMRRPSKAA